MPGGCRDAIEHIGDIDVVGAGDDAADIGRAVGGQSLGEARRLIAEAENRLLDLLPGRRGDVPLLIDDAADGGQRDACCLSDLVNGDSVFQIFHEFSSNETAFEYKITTIIKK